MNERNRHERVAGGDGGFVSELQRLGDIVLGRFELAREDERLREPVALTLEATSRRLGELGIDDLSPREGNRANCLVAKREFVQVFAAAHDEAIRRLLATCGRERRRAIIETVDRVLQPRAGIELDWKWADPAEWRFPSEPGTDAYERGSLLASRAGCVLFFQHRGLDDKGIDPVRFAQRLLEIRDEAAWSELASVVRCHQPAAWGVHLN